jgi:xanthine dehydrogenase accessory factor
MEDVWRSVQEALEENERAALATLVQKKGSAPMAGDAKILVKEDGSAVGTIGGGCLEASVWAEAGDVIETGVPKLLSFELTEKEAAESGLICGGQAVILVEAAWPEPDLELYAALRDLRDREGRGVVCTLLPPEDAPDTPKGKLLVVEGGRVPKDYGTMPEPERSDVIERCADVLGDEEQSIIRLSTGRELLFEPIGPRPTIYLFGGGHVCLAAAQAASICGFRIIVVDDREQFSNPDRFPMAERCVVGDFRDVFDQLDIDEYSYIVSSTRGHQFDEVVVEGAVKTQAAYIGMIGSKGKVAATWRNLEARGVPREKLERVYAPIGLEIEADTPQEIGIAIVAEIIKVRRTAMKAKAARRMAERREKVPAAA